MKLLSVLHTDADRIEDFETFIELFDTKTPENIRESWNKYEQSEGVCFYRLNHDEFFSNVNFCFKIIVHHDLRVVLFSGDTEADPRELDWILPSSRLEQWSQLHRMLEHYKAKQAIMEKSNSFHFIKQALESLNKVAKSREIDEIIDPIKARLVMALDRVDPVSDIIYAPVKLEPYEEQEYHEEFAEVTHKQELGEDEEMMLDEERGEFVRAGDVIVEAIEDTDVDVRMLKMESVERKIRRPKMKREKREKVPTGVLVDCEHCDRKQMTKDQLKNHFYTSHVSFALILPCSLQDFFDSRTDPSGAIAAGRNTPLAEVWQFT
jgi:hypothetical protein